MGLFKNNYLRERCWRRIYSMGYTKRKGRSITNKKKRRFNFISQGNRNICISLGDGRDNQKLQTAIFRVSERITSCRRVAKHDLRWFRMQRIWIDLFDMQSRDSREAQSTSNETVSQRSCIKNEKPIIHE